MRIWVERASAVLAIAGGVVLCGVALMTVVSVIGRWVGDRPVVGDVELAQVGVALAIALSLPYCQLHGHHLVVEIFTERASARVRAMLDRCARIAAAIVFALLAWRAGAGIVDLRQAAETTMVLGIPLALAYIAMVPALALASVAALLTRPPTSP